MDEEGVSLIQVEGASNSNPAPEDRAGPEEVAGSGADAVSAGLPSEHPANIAESNTRATNSYRK